MTDVTQATAYRAGGDATAVHRLEDLIPAISGSDRRALARAISLIETGQTLKPDQAGIPTPVIGVTGPPGAGKSTLVSAIITAMRAGGRSVGVLAVDPSSPRTGGALLGDRIRMQDHIEDDGVYIRSMATRGHLGGLATASKDSLAVMALAGFDWLIAETVGVGQSEVEVMDVADIVVLVIGPSWGDQMQADKAGIVEIADILVINKADSPGADEVRRVLADVAGERPVLMTTAITGEGVAALVAAIDEMSRR